MTGQVNLYPSLCRHFKNQTELAHAGCMSRTRLSAILHGEKVFTRAEKKAIAANLIMKLFTENPQNTIDYQEICLIQKAWSGGFDEVFRKKE